jgi:hypothetical protein
MEIPDCEEAEHAINGIRELLEAEVRTLNYLESNWFNRCQKWAFCHRLDFDRTNNLEESHFRALKHSHLVNRIHWRIDTLVSKLISDVMKDYLVAEIIHTERAECFSTIGVDLSQIQIPNEERRLKVQHAQRLLSRIRSRLNDKKTEVDLVIDLLTQTLESS